MQRKMNLHRIKKNTLRSVFITICLMALVQSNNTNGVASSTPANCTEIIPFVGERLVLECNVQSRYSSLWKWNDEKLFAGTTRITYYQNIDIDEDQYSLKLNVVSVLNDGTYLCLENGKKRIDYCLEVKSVPTIVMSVDGAIVSNYFEGIMGKQYNITCKALSSKPVANMILKMNGQSLDSELLVVENKHNPKTFDLSKSIIYTGEPSVDMLNCIAERKNYFSLETNLTMKIYVLPELQIQLKKVNVTDNITISVGVPIVLQCIAFSARSAGTFTWKNGDDHVPSVVSEVTMSSNRFYAGTYDVVSKFIFTPLRSTVLSCSHHTDDGDVAIVLLDVIVDSTNPQNHTVKFITITVLLLLVVIIFAFTMLMRRITGGSTQYLNQRNVKGQLC